MIQRLIKICGIRDVDIAKQTALLGADFIGLIFQPTSRHCVAIDHALNISRVTKENGATPVAVFVNHTAKQMLEICTQTDIQTIQLHGHQSRLEHYLLPDHYQRIYVKPVDLQGNIRADQENGLHYCYPERDFLMFDGSDGKGVAFDWNQFNYQDNFRWFLAGGLTSKNITQAIHQLNPSGVDISSGVENETGEKNIALIQEFIQFVKILSSTNI